MIGLFIAYSFLSTSGLDPLAFGDLTKEHGNILETCSLILTKNAF